MLTTVHQVIGSRRGAARLREGLALSALALAASCVPDGNERLATASTQSPVTPAPADLQALAATEPTALTAVAPGTAAAMNAAIPVAATPSPAASAFLAHSGNPIDKFRSVDCLTAAVYYEAASETDDGQRAVAQVVLNRVRHPAYPNTVCGVVYQGPMRAGGGCQFTFTCDGALARRPSIHGWARARRVAAAALAGYVHAPVGHATHYHTDYVFPHWAPKLVKTAVIGAHIFYRFPSNWGQPGAFRERYAGREPDPYARALAAALAKQSALPALPGAPLAIQTANLAAPVPGQPEVVAPPEPDNNLPKVQLTDLGLPQSTVREAFRNSGAIKERPVADRGPEAPAAE